MPYIVVVVDEMSDLMLISSREIEGYVQKLSAMARAAGIHIIMATQRPSVDVITVTIKANFPTRISFQVSSKIDSKTILGEQGAEQLLGKGDMLFMSSANKIFRIHGPYISEGEIEKITSSLRSQGNPDYIEEITTIRDKEITDNDFNDGKDELYDDASKIPMKTTVNPDGSISSEGSGELLGGELFTPGQPLTEKQKMTVKMGIDMGNTFSPEIMESYNMETIKPIIESDNKNLQSNVLRLP